MGVGKYLLLESRERGEGEGREIRTNRPLCIATHREGGGGACIKGTEREVLRRKRDTRRSKTERTL